MKVFICLISALCLSLTLLAQQGSHQKCDYSLLYKQGSQAAKDSLFDKALLCFNSARRCNPSKGKEIDDAIQQVFRGIQKQKETAIQERARAIEQTNIAEREKNNAIEEIEPTKLPDNRKVKN
jgi:hypothetical protein